MFAREFAHCFLTRRPEWREQAVLHPDGSMSLSLLAPSGHSLQVWTEHENEVGVRFGDWHAHLSASFMGSLDAAAYAVLLIEQLEAGARVVVVTREKERVLQAEVRSVAKELPRVGGARRLVVQGWLPQVA